MNEEQKYLFDLQGYIVIKNLLPKHLIDECNEVLSRIEALEPDQYPSSVIQSKERTDSELYVSNIVEADPVFHRLIDIPEVLDVVREVSLGLFRLNHTYAIYRWGEGYTYMHMGATPLHPKATYTCQNGQIFSLLTKAVFPMLNHRPEDGCFAVIPGSHKACFKRPWGDHPDENPPLVPVAAGPGDAVVFSEALAHGSMVNTSGRPRRTVFYCYSVGYMPDWGKLGLSFSEEFSQSLSEDRREIVRLKQT
ncbi:MAG: phytanoyl-CoA dioxygenase family protein [Rhodothermales bacterium]|nr:phytanoyl-CoA dioxygenase family protein [Rhodothermales bacterium]